MTIASTTTQTSGSPGNGVTTTFNFTMHIDHYGATAAEDQVQVIRETVATGTEAILTRGSDYSVSVNGDQGSSPGGSITMLTGAPSSAYRIWIRLNPNFTQQTDYQNQGGFMMETVEDQADQQGRQILWLRDAVLKAPRVGVQGGPNFNGEITGDLVAGYMLVLKHDLSGWQLGGPASAAVSVAMTPVVGATDLAEANELLAEGNTGDGWRKDGTSWKLFVDGNEAFRFYDAGTKTRFGTVPGINTFCPEFEFYPDLAHPKLFAPSLFLSDPGDTPEVCLMSVSGTRASPAANTHLYDFNSFVYNLTYDGTATAPQGPLILPDASDGAGSFPYLGRTGEISFPNWQVASQTARGGGILFSTCPIDTIVSVQRVFIDPYGGLVSLYRAAYEDTGISYPWNIAAFNFGDLNAQKRSAPGDRNFGNTPSRGNFTAIVTDRSNGAILAARRYSDTTDGIDLSYDTSNDSLNVDRLDNGTRIRCVEVLRTNGTVDIGFATDGANRIVRIDPTDSSVTVRKDDDSAAVGPIVNLLRHSTTPAAGDDLAGLYFQGRDSAGNVEDFARIRGRLQTATSTAEDGQLDFQTVQGGAVSGRMRVGAGVFHTSATGGDKGNNTLNFGAVYDDNSLLSCYVFDAAFDGKIDEAKWDARVANVKIEAQPRRRVPRMEKRSRQESGIEVVDGVAREVTRDIEFEAPVFDEIPVVDADGNPVMELIEPAGVEPAFDEAGEPMTEEVEEWVRDGKGRRMFDADEKPLTQIVRVQSQKPKPAVMRQKMHRVPVYDWVDATPAEEIERKHDAMRKFKARLGTETDPLDLDAYVAHMREKRHLTSMPNEARFDVEKGLPTGAWIQRLVETVEIQAVHIAKLHERLKALGG